MRATRGAADPAPGTYSSRVLHSDYAGQNCSIARTLEAVGERWTLLIVRELIRRPNRFNELERTLGIAKNILTNRLEKLIAAGIVEARPRTDARQWNDYGLTRKGRDLFPVVHALMTWGDTYAAPAGPPVVTEHRCGSPVGNRHVCAGCGEGVYQRDLTERPGPGAQVRRKATSA